MIKNLKERLSALFCLKVVIMGYTTPAAAAKDSFTEKKSEFIGHIAPVSDEQQAVDFINSVRAEHRKARHNVYAYILRKDNISRYSDDGEPQGTGGVPVLEVLKKEGLTDVCVVVTRYFGGILLGGGGLIRAYSHACKLAVDAAGKKVMMEAAEVTAKCDYSLYGRINCLLPEFGVKMTDSSFEDSVTLKFLVREELISSICEKLTDACNGRIQLEVSEIRLEDMG